MDKITLELELDPSDWEVLLERTKRDYPDIKKEMYELGETFTFDDAIRMEIWNAITKDIEMFDVFDFVRNDPEVKRAVNNAILRRKDDYKDFSIEG